MGRLLVEEAPSAACAACGWCTATGVPTEDGDVAVATEGAVGAVECEAVVGAMEVVLDEGWLPPAPTLVLLDLRFVPKPKLRNRELIKSGPRMTALRAPVRSSPARRTTGGT